MDADVSHTCSHGSAFLCFQEETGRVGCMRKGESSCLRAELIHSPWLLPKLRAHAKRLSELAPGGAASACVAHTASTAWRPFELTLPASSASPKSEHMPPRAILSQPSFGKALL